MKNYDGNCDICKKWQKKLIIMEITGNKFGKKVKYLCYMCAHNSYIFLKNENAKLAEKNLKEKYIISFEKTEKEII